MSKEIWVFAIGFLSFLTLVSAQTPLQLSPVISTDKIDFYRTGKNTAVQTQALEKISITGNTDNRDYLNVRRVQLLRILISILFITLIALIFFISYQRKTRKERDKVLLQLYKNEQELVKSKYEIKISKAEMKAARARINPHLLFNSLNAVHYLLQSIHPTKYILSAR